MTSVLVSSVRYSILTRPADPQSRSPNPQTKTDLQIQTIHAKPTYRMNPRSANKTTTGGGRKEERRVPCSRGIEQERGWRRGAWLGGRGGRVGLATEWGLGRAEAGMETRKSAYKLRVRRSYWARLYILTGPITYFGYPRSGTELIAFILVI